IPPRYLGGYFLATVMLVIKSLAASAVTFTNDTTISFDNTNFDAQEIVITNCTVTIDGSHTFANVHVLSGGIVTHSFSADGLLETPGQPVPTGLNLTVTNNFEIEPGGQINATARGYGGGAGPGAGTSSLTNFPYPYVAGAGGAYGGCGGASSTRAAGGNA